MRLSEERTIPGLFWLPDNPSDTISGTLHIAETGAIKLELHRYCEAGVYVTEDRPLGYPPITEGDDHVIGRILGLIGNEPLTLEECSYSNWRALPIGGIATSTIRASYAFLGAWFEIRERMELSRLEFEVEGLDIWLGIIGFNTNYDFEDTVEDNVSAIRQIKVLFEKPEEITFTLPGNSKLRLKFSYCSRHSADRIESHITQIVSLVIEPEKPLSIDQLLNLTSKITNLFRFIIDAPVSITSITGYSENKTRAHANSGTINIPIKIYNQTNPFEITAFRTHTDRMLFRYRDIVSQMQEILTNWFDNYKVAEPTFKLYFANMLHPRTYLENRFLMLIRAVESLHRSRYGGTVMPEEEFDKFQKSLINSIADCKLRKLLRGSLRYANEPTLRRRLKELIDPVARYFGNSKKRSTLINRVMDTRNYLTHLDDQLSCRSARDDELWALCEKLVALIQLHYMRLIGLQDETIQSIIDNNTAIKTKLNL